MRKCKKQRLLEKGPTDAVCGVVKILVKSSVYLDAPNCCFGALNKVRHACLLCMTLGKWL